MEFNKRRIDEVVANVEQVAIRREENTRRMEGCPLELFMRTYVPTRHGSLPIQWGDGHAAERIRHLEQRVRELEAAQSE